MSDEIRLHRLGVEKLKRFERNFDLLCDEYREKAIKSGYKGSLKFIKERGKVIIYSVIELQ